MARPRPLRFEPYHRLDGRPSLILDGSPTEGTALTVTHWPGYPPPEPIADDLSAQMAFGLLDRPDLVPADVDVASNNHFDQDGLVSLVAVIDPDAAQARRARLVEVARAGDFAVTDDRDAARLSMAISAVASGEEPALGPQPHAYDERTGVLYDELIGRLPEWCDHPDRIRHLWADEDAMLDASDAAFQRGSVSIEERPEVDLAIVRVAGSAPTAGGHRFGGAHVAGLHPMATFARTDRSVVCTIRDRQITVEHRYETWVQLRSRPVRARRDLVPLAARLQDAEPGETVWTADPVGALTPRLATGEGPTALDPDVVIAHLVDHLVTAAPAWDPWEEAP